MNLPRSGAVYRWSWSDAEFRCPSLRVLNDVPRFRPVPLTNTHSRSAAKCGRGARAAIKTDIPVPSPPVCGRTLRPKTTVVDRHPALSEVLSQGSISQAPTLDTIWTTSDKLSG